MLNLATFLGCIFAAGNPPPSPTLALTPAQAARRGVERAIRRADGTGQRVEFSRDGSTWIVHPGMTQSQRAYLTHQIEWIARWAAGEFERP
jgi:hypothetical protein